MIPIIIHQSESNYFDVKTRKPKPQPKIMLNNTLQ